MLSDKQIITRTNLLDEKKIIDIKLVLSEKEVQEYNEKKLIYKNIIWENKFYQLGEIEPMAILK